MKAFINIIKGFRKTRQVPRLILLLFLLNFLFSLILAVPMYHSLRDSFGNSLVSETMLESFDYLWWEEYRDQSEGLEKTFTPAVIGQGSLLINLENLVRMTFLSLPPAVLMFGLLYILFHAFLAGGVLTVLNQEHPVFKLKKFFHGAGNFFLPFAGYMLLFWFFLFSLAGPLRGFLDDVLNRIARTASSEIFPFVLELVFSAFVLFLILFFHMIFDYARIKTVQNKNKAVFKNTLSAFQFVFKNPGTTVGLYAVIFFAGILFSGLYILTSSLIIQNNLFWISVGFLVQQIFIAGIIWIRCWLYAGESELNRYLS